MTNKTVDWLYGHLLVRHSLIASSYCDRYSTNILEFYYSFLIFSINGLVSVGNVQFLITRHIMIVIQSDVGRKHGQLHGKRQLCDRYYDPIRLYSNDG